MKPICPHCGARNFTAGALLSRGMMLWGNRAPLLCANCGGLSYIPLNGPNAFWGLGILVVGFIISYPSAISEKLFAGLSISVAIMRLEIWAIAVLTAYVVFTFAGPLRRVEGNLQSRRPFNPWISAVRYLFLAMIALHGYFLYQGLNH